MLLPVELDCEDDKAGGCGFCGTVRLLLSTRVFATSANSGAVLNIYQTPSNTQKQVTLESNLQQDVFMTQNTIKL